MSILAVVTTVGVPLFNQQCSSAMNIIVHSNGSLRLYEAFNDGHPVSRNRRQYANNGVLFGDYRRNYTVFGNGMIDLSFNEFCSFAISTHTARTACSTNEQKKFRTSHLLFISLYAVIKKKTEAIKLNFINTAVDSRQSSVIFGRKLSVCDVLLAASN